MKKIHKLGFTFATVASLALIVGTTNSFAATAKPTPKATTKPMPAHFLWNSHHKFNTDKSTEVA